MEQGHVHEHESRNLIRDEVLRKQLLVRRERLHAAQADLKSPGGLVQLLHEVDAALERMDAGTFGLCESCSDSIENDRLLADPLCRNCLDHLSPAEQRALERDLDLAFQVQNGLLPKPGVAGRGWTMAYHYEPVGPVSGDYCDLIALDDGTSLFLLGDVMGKGVAASMLMAHLHAIFRSLTIATRRVNELVAKANRVFCEGTLSSFFATLVCGSLGGSGEVEVCNAGHCRPLYVHDGRVSQLEPTGLPLGMFCESEYTLHKQQLAAGDSLVVYSDGLSETFNSAGEQFGVEHLSRIVEQRRAVSPKELLAALLEDLALFRAGAPRTDDLTVMIVRRET